MEAKRIATSSEGAIEDNWNWKKWIRIPVADPANPSRPLSAMGDDSVVEITATGT